jgi:hypothetical protein
VRAAAHLGGEAVSKRAERLAWDVIAAVQQHAGVAKAAGGAAALHAVVFPLAEILIEQNRAITRTSKAVRKQAKTLRRMGLAPAPAGRGMVPLRPGEWRAVLAPAAGLQAPRNGFHHGGADDDDSQGDGPWHDPGGLG